MVVGHSPVNNFTHGDAMIFTNGSAVDLNNLIPTSSKFSLFNAVAINNSGQILAFGTNDTDYSTYAYLLNPTPQAVPEPSTFVIFGCVALAGYFHMRRGRFA